MAANDSTVQYRDVPGFLGYRVGSDGTVWSCFGSSGWKRKAHSVGTNGYLIVTLTKDGQATARKIHTLVLTAFVGPRLANCECRHLDGNRTNNCLSNLKWGTKSENNRDRDRHGTTPRGESHGCSKLVAGDVIEIRRRHSAGESASRIAQDKHVSRGTVNSIVARKTWAHIP